MPITTRVVSSNPTHDKVCSIQHYVIKFVSDLQQVSGFLQVVLFPQPIELFDHDITEILLKVALSTITLNLNPLCEIFFEYSNNFIDKCFVFM